MDFRQFFDGFFKLNEELGNFFEESLLNKDIFLGSVNENRKDISPREMMLKSKSERPSSFIDIIDPGDKSFQSKSFVQTFNSDNNSGSFQEKIVIKNSDGNEKIITKYSSGGRTTHKEIVRKGNQIISEKEVVSDIGDDIGKIGFDQTKNGNSQDDNFGSFWNWFK